MRKPEAENLNTVAIWAIQIAWHASATLVAWTHLLAFCALAWSNTALALEVVKVGFSDFPPFMVVKKRGQSSSTTPMARISGVGAEMLRSLNALQSNYRFEVVLSSPRRRIRDFRAGKFDMAMFENIAWGWQELPVGVSDVFLTGDEVYIAQAKPGRGQEYFSDFSDKRMIGVLGYHYRFAQFESDPTYLKKTYNMQLTTSHAGTIRMILAGNRGDIAIVTRLFLTHYLQDHPEHRPKLLVSDKLDQQYNHTILIRKGIGLSVDELNGMLNELRSSGELDRIFRLVDAVK